MTHLKIITDPVQLKKKSEEIENPHLDEYKELANEMIICMNQNNGVGLAAPQIGKLIRLIVVKGGLDGAPIPDDLLLANPIITNRSQIKDNKSETCLSVPNKSVKKKRSLSIDLEAWDIGLGMKVKLHCTGLSARCIQHEIDHLNGIILE